MIHCKIDRKVDCDSDHLSIGLVFDWNWQPETPAKKRLWAKTNSENLRKIVQAHLPRTDVISELTDRDCIDKFVSFIIEALETGIAASTP